MKIHPFEAELFRADGRTDGVTDSYDEANSRFRSFGNTPKPNHLKLHREIITVLSEIHTEHINTLCGC